MKIVKPAWLVHNDDGHNRAIFSLDVSPDGTRLVTGGLDGKVRVWSVAAVKGLANQQTSAPQPHQLSSMANHNGAVTVVRFSPDGRYIASGSDDYIGLIWEIDASRAPRKEFGNTDETESEVWAARKRLIGHEGDIQDVAWSPDGSLLVSVGLDSFIYVWSGTTFEKLKKIECHESPVKGITFDPAGKYFFTASDDRTARVVRYAKTSPTQWMFSVEGVIKKPFEYSPLSTYFRRCSWSPSGEYIACAAAANGPVSTVCIINRGEWDSDISLVGHDGPCEVAAFSPRLYGPKHIDKDFDSQKEAVSIVASGGIDKVLTLWNTADPRPVLVARNVATKALCDIAWCPDGLNVFACSMDGTVVMLSFDEAELGYPLDVDVANQQLLRYGRSQNDIELPESAEQLAIEDKYKSLDKPDVPMEVDAPSTAPSTAPIAAPSTAPEPPAAPVVPPVQTVEPAAPEKSTASPARREESVQQRVKKAKITITKDGRKRVAPTLITEAPAGRHQQSLALAPPVVPSYTQEYSGASRALPRGGVGSLIVGNRNGSKQESLPKRPEPEAKFIKPAVINPATTVSQVRLGTPKVVSHLSTSVSGQVLEARNGEKHGDPCRVTVSDEGKIVWLDYIFGFAQIITGGDFWVVATDEGSVYVYTAQGSRAMPPLVLGASLAYLLAKDSVLIAITSIGMVYCWDLKARKALFAPVSLAPVLDVSTRMEENGLVKGPSVTQCLLHGTKILITLSCGSAYTYDPDMLSWARVSETLWACGSQYWDSTGFSHIYDGGVGGPISVAERRVNEVTLLRAGSRGKSLQRMARTLMLRDGYEGFEDVVSLAHLETRVASAALMDSHLELEKYLELYVQRLSQSGMRDKLVSLFEFLLGNSEPLRWPGVDRRALLKRFLPVAGKFRTMQTLVAEYDTVLEERNGREPRELS